MSIELHFSKQEYIAKFAAKPVVSSETIEAWMSAGVLTPDETTGATRILNLMRQQRMDRRDSGRFSRVGVQVQNTPCPRGIQKPLAAIGAAAGRGGRRMLRWFFRAR